MNNLIIKKSEKFLKIIGGLMVLILFISSPSLSQQKYYLRDHNPWGTTNNAQAMDAVFGAGNWLASNYSISAATVFNSNTQFVYMEGGENNDTYMNNFLVANRTLIENWVLNGGGLFLNSAGWNTGMDYGFGGVQLIFGGYSSNVVAANPAHSIFNGPFTPAGTSFSGNYFSHDYITGTGLINIILGTAGGNAPVLASKIWGSGFVLFGGITSPYFHQPNPNAQNLFQNILAFLKETTSNSLSTSTLESNNYCQGEILSVPFIANGTFNAGNTFTAQLSDASGSFSVSIIIGSINATISETINATIPINTPAGSGYRVRVVSSNPAVTGSDNGSDITIKSLPSVICPDNITANAVSGQCGTNVSFNASGVGTISYSPASGSFFPIGSTTVTTTATTDCGSASCSFTVTVIDNEPPSITCPAPVTINASPGLCTGTTTLVPPIVTDNCNSFGNALSFDGGYVNVPNASILNPFNEWTLETWVKRANTGVQEGLIEKYIEPGNTYGYLLRILGNNKAMAGFVFGSFAGYFITGTTTILPNTWYHLAATFNRTTGVMKLYVNGVLDAQVTGMTGLPTIPNTASLKLGARGDDAATRLSNGGIMDEIRIWSVERTQAQIQLSMNSESGAQAGLVALYHLNQGIAGGNNTGLTTATDASGNVNNGSLISFALTGPTSNWVNGKGFGLTVTNDAPITYPKGNTNVTWTATDGNGNTATCTQVVTVVDNQSPVFTCPANQNVNLNGTCQLVVPDLVSGLTGSDNCGTVTFTQSPLAGAPLTSSHNQTQSVVITASDGNGNTQTCTVILTGKDVTKPTFICPDNQNVNLNGTCQLIVPNLIAELIGNDNCGTVTFTQTPLAGASLASSHNQSHNVVITANDGNGNTETCTVVLTGKDVTKPTFTCPGNQNVNLNVTCQLIVPNLIAELTGNDNCGTVTFTQSPVIGASFASSHNQTQSVMITASDGNGNTQTCTVILTGKDVTKPTFTCPDNQNVNLNGTCQLLVPNLISELTGNDNCGTVTFTQSPVAGELLASSHNQTHSVVITASDGNGNVQTCTVVLTGKDVTKPIFTCPNDRNVNLNGTCQLIIPNLISGLTGNDNCGIVTFTQSPVAGALFASSHNQTQNVLITASDGNGNTQTCTVVLTAKDVTLPVITCPSPKTISCDASLLPANTGSATATDNCGGSPVITYSDVSGQDPNPSHVGYYNYTITRTWMATDVATNTSTCDQTITVQDITKPMITCPANKLNVPFDFGQVYATIAIGTATTTDNCAGNANIAIAGTRSDNVVITNQQYSLGQTTVAWSATDPSDNSDGCTQTITVRKRNTAVTYTGDMIDSKICVQYSDIINLQAKLTDNEGLATPNNISGRTITFQLLSGTTVLRSKSATTNASGIAVDTFKIEQAPGLYSVKTIFAGDTYFNGNNDQDNCEVKQEDAILEYNGSQYFTTASATTLVGSITLAAAVNDIDDGSDKRGDIRKAKTTFRDGGPGGTVLGSANLPVGLVNPGILTNGLSATTQNNITLNSNDASSGGKIFQVWVGASDHYKGADAGPTPVTLALPGQDFVTGGGHLVVTNSAGTYAGTVNSKMNFGFTMKWNKSGKNLQGNINIVFRKWQLYNNEWQWRVYQMKSNAINSMAVVEVGSNGQPVSGTNPAAFRKAIINTKANLKDVTDPLNNIDLGGNHNLTLDAWDHITANGGVSDKISVTLMGATTNELLFSSSWVSNATQAQTITGGNINVRNGSSSSSTTINTITRSGQMEIAAKEDGFVVKAYPNPTEHEFTLVVTSSLNEKIEIQLYDAAGRKIQTLSAKANETIRFGEKLKAGVYVAQVMQGNKKESIKLIKQ